jgi:hypothetical protein
MQTTRRTDNGKGRQAGQRAGRALDLDALAQLDARELGELYAQGRVPESVSALDGHPRGRLLAARRLDRGPAFAALRAFARLANFPWEGKSFTSRGATEGRGVNRVVLGGRHGLFPFETRVEASGVDGRPAVVLDYDLPDNPRFIRAIHDEIRLIEEGLYLGPAMWKTRSGLVLALWFALDTQDPCRPLGERVS